VIASCDLYSTAAPVTTAMSGSLWLRCWQWRRALLYEGRNHPCAKRGGGAVVGK